MPDYQKLFDASQAELMNIEESLEELLYQVRCARLRGKENTEKSNSLDVSDLTAEQIIDLKIIIDRLKELHHL